jgi:hypothetical protein
MAAIHFPTDPVGIVVYVVGLIVLWFVASIPVYFAGRAIKGRDVSFGDALGATLGGVIAYYIVYLLVAFFLGAVIGSPAGVIALLMGLLVWLGVFRSTFRTTWPGAVGIVVLAWLILLVIDLVLVGLFGVSFPDFFPF